MGYTQIMLKQYGIAEFLSQSLDRRAYLTQWRSIQINLFPALDSENDANALMMHLQESLPITEGFYCIESPRKILLLGKVDAAFHPKKLEAAIASKTPEYKCKMHGLPSKEGDFKKIEINLLKESEFSKARANRTDKIFMVIDDDAFLRGLIDNALKPFGKVISRHDGNDVLELYKTESPDYVLLDIHLPGESGIEILKKILSIDPQANIIMISSDSVRENVLDTMSHGASWFLSKPFTKEKILDSVRRCGVFENV